MTNSTCELYMYIAVLTLFVFYHIQVIYYSTNIFISANLSNSNAQYATIGLGGILIGMTFVSLVLIERLGRRTLHLHGLLGMFVCMALLTASYLLEVCISLV